MNLRKHLHLGLGLSFCSVLVLPACGDSGSAETGAGPTTAGSDTGSSTACSGAATGTTADSHPTTGPTGGSGGQTDSGTTTGTSATGSTSASTGTTETGTSDNTSSTGGTTGAEEFIPCETEKDCVLADGCCECEPVHINEAPHACDVMECLTNVCAIHGLEGAPVECRFGRCTFAKVPCNPLGITCKSLPPVCPVDQVPGVLEDDNGKCWSGYCVPAEACDWVPDCAACADEELVCVGKLAKGRLPRLRPAPPTARAPATSTAAAASRSARARRRTPCATTRTPASPASAGSGERWRCHKTTAPAHALLARRRG